jgi:DNA-binding CsgD family transcriptional regulator
VVARAQGAFVGRAHELEELERALDAARAGSGSTALVAGDAGIGKSRLAAETAERARGAGFDVLVGRAIDLVGTELPYQPFVEALRPLGELRHGSSQLRVFEGALGLLAEHAAEAPVLLVLEDLHWADASTLDLVVFLAHNLPDQRILLLATFRADEASSAERVRRVADGVQRSGSGLVLDLGPLEPDELSRFLTARGDLPPSMTDAIVTRSEGNPFFAEELLAAAADQSGELPHGLRELLLQRVNGLDRPTQGLLRLAAAAGRDVGYPLLAAAAELPEPEVRESLRRSVEAGVLVAEPAAGSFRFRHALLAEAIYSTVLPGEREQLHERLAEELARSGAASAAELAPHWAAAGRSAEALVASIGAARQAEAVFGLAEAHAHLERALALWPAVPDSAELAEIELADVCEWASDLAGKIGDAARAVELARQAIDLVGPSDPHRAALLHVQLGEYLYERDDTAAFSALERAVELVPAEPPSPERAYALGSLAGGLMVASRHEESLPIAREALVLARRADAGEAEVRALTVIGGDLAYLGHREDGLAYFEQALQLAEHIGDLIGLERAYTNFTDALTMLGRPGDSARLGQKGLAAMGRYGIEATVLVSNRIEALLAIGDWYEADRLSAEALRRLTSSPPDLVVFRAAVEIGRGDFAGARNHLESGRAALRGDRMRWLLDVHIAELALWERRWTDADAAIREGLPRAQERGAAQVGVQLCAEGLRAHAELVALARARRDREAADGWLDRAGELIGIARSFAAEIQAITPNAGAWLALAEAEYDRARGVAQPDAWSEAAALWDRLERPPLVAYCRWREAEALVGAGASRTEASAPLREAHAIAARIGAVPLVGELDLLAQRARLDLVSPEAAVSEGRREIEEALGVTPREAEVLALVARGYTNREIADELVISTKTASVHVSHILRKLGASNRLEAATIAHRLGAPASGAGD